MGKLMSYLIKINVKRDKRNARNNKVEIIGDSMFNGLIDDKLSKHNTIKTVKHPGWTSNDLRHEVMKTIENKPNLIYFTLARMTSQITSIQLQTTNSLLIR